MFDTFGNMDTAEEINQVAVNLRKEGDTEGVKTLAKENGIEEDIAALFLEGEILYITDVTTAAISKLEMEKKDMNCAEIMDDWIGYVETKCNESEEIARAVRRSSKNLKSCIAEILKWSFKHQYPVDKDIKKAAGVTANKVTLGIPGALSVQKIIREYYLR